MKIKEQTRKLAAGCSKHCFEVVDRTDEVSSKHGFEVVDETDEVSSKHGFEVVDETDEVSNHTYGKIFGYDSGESFPLVPWSSLIS
ncbi:chlorohydrolase [Streptococcus pneumoniae]|nr:chlorohydrolase [Streptococcus pneumoniae]